MSQAIAVHFWWHFHQPSYLLQGEATLPWVFLHGCRDYLDMGKVIEEEEGVQVTFNFTPILVEQLLDHRLPKALDPWVSDVSQWDEETRQSMLQRSFDVGWVASLQPFPRYRQLLALRGSNPSPQELKTMAKTWSKGDWEDLAFYFLLGWCGETIKKDQDVLTLMKKEKGYTLEDRQFLAKKMLEAFTTILPTYQKLHEEGRIGLTTTPYYHPILPLLVNPQGCQKDHPHLPFPPITPDIPSAKAQVAKALAFHEEVFGTPPDGLWPAEGALSDDALKEVMTLPAVGTDEFLLRRALSNHPSPAACYRFQHGPLLLFRDHTLSDNLGFHYGSLSLEEGVGDFLGYVEKHYQEGVVHVILDGENPWGNYPGLGRTFLRQLYRKVHEKFTTCHVKALCYKEKPKILPHLPSGSWVDGSFTLWIGDPMKNRAWLILEELKSFFTSHERPDAYLRAQGSDWFWWYGEGNYSPLEPEFDKLFRAYVMESYQALKVPPPLYLDSPIRRESLPIQLPQRFIHPHINGKVDSFWEWWGAGKLTLEGASMAFSGPVTTLYFGVDGETLFLRMDGTIKDWTPSTWKLIFLEPKKITLSEKEITLGKAKVVEMAVPYTLFGGLPEREVRLFLMVSFQDRSFRFPSGGPLTFTLPPSDFEETQWSL